MTHTVQAGPDSDGLVQCWCCADREPDDRMVHLGNHPEVAVCLPCAHALSKWAAEAEDRGKSGVGVTARSALRRARAEVIRRGWHRSPTFGRWLRRVGRHLP